MARKSVLYLLAVMLKHQRIKEFCYDNESNEGYVCTSNADTTVKQHYFIPFTCNDSYDELDMMSKRRTKVFTFKKTTTTDEFTKLLIANKKHIAVSEDELAMLKIEGAGASAGAVARGGSAAAAAKTVSKVLGLPVDPPVFDEDEDDPKEPDDGDDDE